jgi:predicted secreted protein
MITYLFALMISASTPAATPSDATETPPPPKEKLICTRSVVTGSPARSKRVCQTRAQREAEIDEARKDYERTRAPQTRNSH